MRRGLVLVTLMCLALVACSTSSSKGTLPTLATVAPPPTNAIIANAPSTLPGTQTTFEYSVFIVSVDLAVHTITVDPMSFLTGSAATAAFKHDNPGAKEGPPNDYYIVNPTKDQDLLPLSPKVVVKLVHVGGTDHTQPVKVAPTSLLGYPSLTIRPFIVSGLNGTVDSVVERFVP
jgi:hypothetical protein